MALVGSDTKTLSEVHVGDADRRSGLYILGKPGMGKSTLLVNLLLQDIEQGNSCFFLDPHGQAIDDVLERSPYLSKRNVHLLNPTDDDFAFGINPLYCPNINVRSLRAEAENKAKSIFQRIFEGDSEGVWLPLILDNALPVLIEMGYTLAEMPLFLLNRNFREFVLKQVKYSAKTIDFWRYEFKEEQVQPVLVRVRRLLGGEYVRYIIGQQKSTIDFNSLVRDEGNVILLRLSPTLSEDARRFIGTIVVTELLTAIKGRDAQQREKPFSIFVDEFQHFATDQFAEFINEGRKFGCQITLAHQERVGQFGENQKILGATMACANKIIFQCTVKDARELAPEFAEKPTFTETRKIPELVISKEPIWDLHSKGHPNQRVQTLIYKYINPMHDRFWLWKQQIEQLAAQRLRLRDEAAVEQDYSSMTSLSAKTGRSVRGNMFDQTIDAVKQVLETHKVSEEKAWMIYNRTVWLQQDRRDLKSVDQFLTDLMEGQVGLIPGEERVLDYLKHILLRLYGTDHFKYYLEITFGNSLIPREIPNDIAEQFWRRELEENFRLQLSKPCLPEDIGNIGYIVVPGRDALNQEQIEKVIAYYFRGQPKGIFRNAWGKEFLVCDDRPKNFPARNLKSYEIPMVRESLRQIIMVQDKEKSRDSFEGIAEMLELAQLLSEPDNHVRVPSGVYKEVAVHISSTQEMINQAVQTLTEHPKYIASYKTIAHRNGEEVTEKGVMRTNDFLEGKRNYSFQPACIGRTHDEIDQEIAERREEWRKSLPRGREIRPGEEKPPPNWD